MKRGASPMRPFSYFHKPAFRPVTTVARLTFPPYAATDAW